MNDIFPLPNSLSVVVVFIIASTIARDIIESRSTSSQCLGALEALALRTNRSVVNTWRHVTLRFRRYSYDYYTTCAWTGGRPDPLSQINRRPTASTPLPLPLPDKSLLVSANQWGEDGQRPQGRRAHRVTRWRNTVRDTACRTILPHSRVRTFARRACYKLATEHTSNRVNYFLSLINPTIGSPSNI